MSKGKETTKDNKTKSEKTNSEKKTTTFSSSWLATSGLVLAVALLAYQMLSNFATPRVELVSDHFAQVPCSTESYAEEAKLFPRCIPRIRCGRFATESLVTSEEANHLLSFAQRGMSLTNGGSGGATIMDLGSGAVSHGEKFVSLWRTPNARNILKPEDFSFFKEVHEKVKAKISGLFGIPTENLYLTKPCFFSRLTNVPAKTLNDEYWHEHIDKETYGKFIYTALIYLSSYGDDFEGGQFVFLGDSRNVTVTPKKGLFVTFSSGAENPHLVERVTDGRRFTLTIAFACDPSAAIAIPKWQGE